MFSIKSAIGLCLLFSLACAAKADETIGNIVGVDRKIVGKGNTCGGKDLDHLLWVQLKRADNSAKVWFVVEINSDAGKQVLAMGLSAMTSSIPVRVTHPATPFCTGDIDGRSPKSLESIWASSDGF